ncbi:MAG: hypothetical protein ACRCTY_01415, partial [Candidatus Adiutrix sp.]
MESINEVGGLLLKGINPIERFPCGAIYPVFEGEGEDPALIEDSAVHNDIDDASFAEDGKESEPVRRYVSPSSIGVSICLASSCDSIEVSFCAARYEKEGNEKKGNEWVRTEMGKGEVFYAPQNDYDRNRKIIFDGHAFADIVWRKHGTVWIVTISLCNKKVLIEEHCSDSGSSKFMEKRAEATLFEAHLEVNIPQSKLQVYPGIDLNLLDEEEQEIELQYRSQKEYAIGHGTGVRWENRGKNV